MIFAKPGFLFLLLLLIPIIIWYVWKRNSHTAKLQMSTCEPFVGSKKTYKYYLLHVPFALKMIGLAFLIIVLARPQASNEWDNKTVEGIDIMMTMDISTSMLAQDLKPNRITASKDVAIDFVKQRKNDNIGLVVFSGAACTICPLTTDKNALSDLIASVDTGMVQANGTAIGIGIATAVNRIKDSKAKSKVIILLTDGSDTGGSIDPMTGAELAKSFGVRVYTIGVGTNGMAPTPVWDQATNKMIMVMAPVEIDEETLKKIASRTDGKFFRATSTDELKGIYSTIDKLEKSKVSVSNFSRRKELYLPFAIGAMAALFLSLIISTLVLRRNP